MTALVAKIGGSLWRSPDLTQWIAALQAFPGPLTLVPGGGPFADAVRAAQTQMRFSDKAAHEMALLAMEQYGLALASVFEGLELAATPQEASALRRPGRIAVWRPSAMTLASDVPASWNVTSDSLSAWYARRSGAPRLLLIKSADAGAGSGLVDPCFDSYARGLEVFIAGPRDVDSAREILVRGDIPGTRTDFFGG